MGGDTSCIMGGDCVMEGESFCIMRRDSSCIIGRDSVSWNKTHSVSREEKLVSLEETLPVL